MIELHGLVMAAKPILSGHRYLPRFNNHGNPDINQVIYIQTFLNK